MTGGIARVSESLARGHRQEYQPETGSDFGDDSDTFGNDLDTIGHDSDTLGHDKGTFGVSYRNCFTPAKIVSI